MSATVVFASLLVLPLSAKAQWNFSIDRNYLTGVTQPGGNFESILGWQGDTFTADLYIEKVLPVESGTLEGTSRVLLTWTLPGARPTRYTLTANHQVIASPLLKSSATASASVDAQGGTGCFARVGDPKDISKSYPVVYTSSQTISCHCMAAISTARTAHASATVRFN